jgi:hypothetical protein
MTIKYPAIVGLTAFASLISAPLAVATHAHGSGFGLHSFHSSNHFRPLRHRAFNQSQLYGGLYALPPYTYGNMDSYVTGNYAVTPSVVYVAEPQRALTCQYSQQVKTVPSESGGTRDITITRC